MEAKFQKNIWKKVTSSDLKLKVELICGEPKQKIVLWKIKMTDEA